MSGKSTQTYKRQNANDSRMTLLGVQNLAFGHEANTGDIFIPFSSLSWSAQAQADTGIINPSPNTLLAANLGFYKNNLMLASSRGPWNRDMYEITNVGIKLKDVALQGERFFGIVSNVISSGQNIVTAKPIYKADILQNGVYEFDFVEPVLIDKNAGMVHPIVVSRGGSIAYPNSNNNPLGTDGDYYIKEIGNTGYGRSIVFLVAGSTDGEDVLVVSNGALINRTQAGMMAELEVQQGVIDKMVADLALVTGNPESVYKSAPSNVDLAYFAKLMNSILDTSISIPKREFLDAYGNASNAITANVTDIPFTNIGRNSLSELGTWTGTTTFTAKEKLIITLSTMVVWSAASGNSLVVYRNGVRDERCGTNNSTLIPTINKNFELDAGESFTIRTDGTKTLSNDTAHRISITADAIKTKSIRQLIGA